MSSSRSIFKRLFPLYLTYFLQGFALWYAIEKPFMFSIGFTSETIALETMILMSVILVLDIPLGILADRWSRKGMLVVSGLAFAVASAICGLSHSVPVYIVGICFWGLFTAAYSGVYSAIVYDTLVEETKSADDFAPLQGRLHIYSSSATVAASLASVLVVKFLSLRAAYFISVPVALLALVPLYYLREPQLHKAEPETLPMAHIRKTFAAVLGNKTIAWLVAAMMAMEVATLLLTEFTPLWYVALSLPLLLYGPANAGMEVAMAAGGYVSAKLRGNRAGLLTSLLLVIVAVLLTLHILAAIVVAVLTLVAGLIVLRVLISKSLHDTLPASIRAGAGSVVNVLGTLAFLPVAYGFGRLSHHSSVFAAGWIVVAVLATLSVAMIIASRGARLHSAQSAIA